MKCIECNKTIVETAEWKLWNSYNKQPFCNNVCLFAYELKQKFNQPFYLLICGSRVIPSYPIALKIVNEVLTPLSKSVILLNGGSTGIDKLVLELAPNFNLKTEIHYPDYDKYRKNAPIRRNIEMMDKATCIIALWDTKSKGTQFIINRARTEGNPIKVYDLNTGEQML